MAVEFRVPPGLDAVLIIGRYGGVRDRNEVARVVMISFRDSLDEFKSHRFPM